MNCNEIERLIPDALGGETSTEDRAALESHLSECAACRADMESMRRTLSMLRELPAPLPAAVHRRGDRLVLRDGAPEWRKAGPAGDATREQARRPSPASGSKWSETSGGNAPRHQRPWAGRTVSYARALRYAAGLFIAFTAGYALHAGLTITQWTTPEPPQIARDIGQNTPIRPDSLQAAVHAVHTRQPTQSTLAKALIAIGRARG